MNKTLKLLGVFSVFVFLLAGCASTVHVEKDETVDFRDYKTFAWVDKDGEGRSDHNKNNDLTEARFKAAVTEELGKSAGWREVKNRPDVLLSYDVLVERTVKETSNPVYTQPYSRLVKNRPDVLLSYDVLVERTVKETSNPVYTQPYSRLVYNPYTRRYSTIYYPSQFIGYDRDERQAREGTVTITVIDAKSDKTVWQGWTTDEVNSKNMTSKEIQYAVRSIFKKFDVAKN